MELNKIAVRSGGKFPDFSVVDIEKKRYSSAAFRKAIERHAMNWLQVFGDERPYHALSIVLIPQLYLVDKKGNMLYNSNAIKNDNLSLLKKLLADHLDKQNGSVLVP